MAVWFHNYRYMASEKKTLEQVQRDVDALTHTEFMKRVASVLATTALYGSSPYYFGGTLTENGTLQRAMVNRLARINGDIELAKEYTKEFADRDADQARRAADASDATPEAPSTVWIDAFSYRQLTQDDSISKALLTTYPVTGGIPMRTLTPEELKTLKTTEL